MIEWLRRLLAESEDFMPHGHCYLWEAPLVWTHVVSDLAIGLAYVAITITLIVLVRRIRGLPFQWMYLAFALFIVSCGLTHFMEVWNVWQAHYWLAALVKTVTAVASVGTALLLPGLVPKAVALAEAAQVSHQRGVELEAAHTELGVLYRKTRELEQLKTQFFANVSHELRTPLALILGPVEKWVGAKEGVSEPLRRDLELVGRNARALLKHVNDLLDVSKLEAGKMQASHAETDLARLVRLAAAQFDGLALDRRMTFAIEAPEALPAQVDPEKLERVVVNLLSNAFKFTPDGGRVRVSLVARDGRASLAVGDSGPGVPAEFRPFVFERFRQAEGGSTRRFGGTGLGLAIAKDFVALHGGNIALGDAPEGGALFTVELPLSAPAGVPVRAAPAEGDHGVDQLARQALEELRSRVDATDAAAGRERPLVLVVEDNAEMGRFLVESLSPDYRCERALDGDEGLRKMGERAPDLVLSDVMMPRRSGDDMVREMRKRPELDGVPVVMLTAKADDELRLDLLRNGAQDYLVKPFSTDELRARVANLVTMKRAREVLQRELDSQVKDLERLARDVTTRKRELETALEMVRVARDHAERASQLKSNFLSLVSHELRTPLTTLLLQLDALKKGGVNALGDEHRREVERMARSTVRLTEMINSLLEYARIESGRLGTNLETLNLVALASEAVAELQPQAAQKRLELRLSAKPDLPMLESDPGVVRTVLVNLVGNAIKFTQQGSIEVTVGHRPEAHEVTVTDTGPGIPAEKLGVIFEPFAQVEPVAHKTLPGVGLGLTIVRDLVRSLGGRIDVRSEVGVGTTFTVTLPARCGAVSA